MQLPERQCSRCKETFPATPDYFHRKPKGKHGLQPVCKPCALLVVKKSAEKPANKEAKRQRGRTPKNRLKENERRKQRRLEAKLATGLPTRKTPWNRQDYEKDPATIAKRKAWQQSEQGKRSKAMINHRRLARIRGLPATMTAGDWNAAISYFKGKCAVCGKEPVAPQFIAADHWIPLKADGCPGTIPRNVVPLCHGKNGCNNKKGTLKPEVFLDRHYDAAEKQRILDRINAYFATLP